MIYDIISKNDVPVTQMHIYLKNKTGNDGGIYPELFNDLAISEAVNGLYAFAIACVETNNFTNMRKFMQNYPSKEVATLAFIQYIKGLATTVQLRNKCVSPLYENLSLIKQLGTSPTLLNLDGDLFSSHYDSTKYFSKDAADEAEDSFPYWVIKVVKEITNCIEIVTPSIKTYELPYYIQNISNENIQIIRDPSLNTDDNIIGVIPPTGIEAVSSIENGYGKLMSSTNAYVFLSDKVRPCKHVVSEEELNTDIGSLQLPTGEFDVVCKHHTLIGRYGTTNHYYDNNLYTYNKGDIIHIQKVFHNVGIIAEGIFISLHSDLISIKLDMPVEEHTNLSSDSEITLDELHIFDDCKYLVIIPVSNEDTAKSTIINILKKTEYKKSYIDIVAGGKFTVVVHGDNDRLNATKVKKKMISVFGYKALVVEYNSFYS